MQGTSRVLKKGTGKKTKKRMVRKEKVLLGPREDILKKTTQLDRGVYNLNWGKREKTGRQWANRTESTETAKGKKRKPALLR